MPPLTKRRKRALAAAATRRRNRALAAAAAPPVIHPADRLSRLPDEILAQILSFLPAQEAVRTCVLARTWRHVWKFTRRLRIMSMFPAQKAWEGLVDGLLRHRLNGLECASLDECEIRFRMQGNKHTRCTVDKLTHYTVDKHTHYTVNRWIRHCLKCQVQTLRVEYNEPGAYFVISNRHLISWHLTRLELCGVWVTIGLDGFPALKHLEIRTCILFVPTEITSLSLKRLVITGCESYGDTQRFKISAPCLVSLWLEVGPFRPPLLESMPELVEAHVKIDKHWDENCSCYDPMGCYHVMQPGYISEGCVLLEGLAQAKDLVLLAHHSMYIFRRDLRLCPTFSNLKTLVLNDYWCKTADCRALACILEHAPVLEKLTVLFSEKVELKYDIVLEGRPDAIAGSAMTTQCLKTVKVKCHTVGEEVQNVLKFLSTLNICFN